MAALRLWPLWFAASLAAAPLEIVQTVVRLADGGAPVPAGYAHVPGESLFITFQVAGYQTTADSKVRVAYTVTSLDPAGVLIVPPTSGVVAEELAPQDKEWRPRVRLEVPIPPLGPSGVYKIRIQVKDEVAKSAAEKEIGFQVQGREVEPSDTVTVRNFRYYRSEDSPAPLSQPIYHPGDSVWARFDIIGYKFGPDNHVDVGYGVAVLDDAGKVLWSQEEAAVERSASFYPKRYISGAMSINLQSTIKPGRYAIAIRLRDAIGKQNAETKHPFVVE